MADKDKKYVEFQYGRDGYTQEIKTNPTVKHDIDIIKERERMVSCRILAEKGNQVTVEFGPGNNRKQMMLLKYEILNIKPAWKDRYK